MKPKYILIGLAVIIDAGQFRPVTMAGLPGSGSSLPARKFEAGTFIQNLEKCLRN